MNKPWPMVKLGEVIRQEHDAIGTFDGDSLPVFGVTNTEGVTQTGVAASDDKSKYLRLRPGRFVYNPYRINVGSIGLSAESQNGICSPAYVVFAPKERIEAKLLWFFLKSARGDQLINFFGNRGSVRSALRFDDLAQIEIPLPPVSEQRRIVARIEELAAQIQEARILRQQATTETVALTRAYFNSAFSILPASCVHELGAVTKIIGGNSLPESTDTCSESRDILFIKVSDMNRPGNESYIGNSATSVSATSSLLRGVRVLPKHSIVFPKRGGAIATNKKRILTKPAVLDPNMMGVFTDNEARLSHDFLFRWFATLDLASLQNGTSVPQINRGDLAPLKIPVPPLAEQLRIVAELDALQAEVDRLKALQAETAAELDALLPSILDRAFKGEL